MMLKTTKSNLSMTAVAILGIIVTFHPIPASGHGRLWEPPARNTMWRRGFNTPVDYNDNQLFCGGFSHQVSQGYRCGVCGDPYDGPRRSEPGGVFATGTIARTYTQGQIVEFEVQLTANHQGFFEFKICPTNSPNVNATQHCLDLHPLTLTDTGSTRYPVNIDELRDVKLRVTLPADLTCSYCVVQWRYHAGNSWGTDANGTSCLGCGYQEEFYGCADVRISPSSGNAGATQAPTSASPTTQAPTSPSPTTQAPTSASPITQSVTSTQTPRQPATTTTTAPPTSASTTRSTTTSTTRTPPTGQGCRSVMGLSAFDGWCANNCARNYCPSNLCTCGPAPVYSCHGIGLYVNDPNIDSWCLNNCPLGNCPTYMCQCFRGGVPI